MLRHHATVLATHPATRPTLVLAVAMGLLGLAIGTGGAVAGQALAITALAGTALHGRRRPS
jgi:hypothetical protein